MCVYIYIYIYVCVYMYMCVCTCVYVRLFDTLEMISLHANHKISNF